MPYFANFVFEDMSDGPEDVKNLWHTGHIPNVLNE